MSHGQDHKSIELRSSIQSPESWLHVSRLTLIAFHWHETKWLYRTKFYFIRDTIFNGINEYDINYELNKITVIFQVQFLFEYVLRNLTKSGMTSDVVWRVRVHLEDCCDFGMSHIYTCCTVGRVTFREPRTSVLRRAMLCLRTSFCRHIRWLIKLT